MIVDSHAAINNTRKFQVLFDEFYPMVILQK